eukprot:scaffold1845_cov178-Ochromonas_danica.AAC.1
MQPSSEVSSYPSTQPSSRPSSHSSVAPSVFNDFPPSFLPTMFPTLSNDELSKVGIRNAVFNFQSDKDADILGSCFLWKSFLLNDIFISAVDSYPIEVSLIVLSDFQLSEPVSIICNSIPIVGAILDTLIHASVNVTSFTCNDHVWSVGLCEFSSPAICVDCTDPCRPPNDRYLSPFHVSPCSSAPQFLPFAGFMSFSFVDQFPPPKVLSMTTLANATSVTVYVEMDMEAVLSCGIFDTSALFDVTQEAILVQNRLALSYEANNSVSIAFDNLIPLTGYKVYCLTQSYTGYTSISNLDDIEGGSVVTATTCCLEIVVNLRSSLLFVGEGRSDAVQVYVRNRPISSVNINLVGVIETTDGQVKNIFETSLSLDSDRFGVLHLPMLPSYTAKAGIIKLYATVLDLNYRIKFHQHDVPVDTFYDTSNNSFVGNCSILVASSSSAIPIPTITSAVFSINGSTVMLTFNIETDLAGVNSPVFACSNILFFEGVTDANCSWLSESQLSVKLGSNRSLSLGGSIMLLYDRVRPKCVYSSDICSAWPSNSAQSVTITGDVIEQPVVSISGPQIVQLGNPVFLDLSYSTGSTGRQWKSVNISVYSTRKVNTELDSFVSSIFYDYKPIEIAGALFKSSGSYNFVVKMCNVFDKCGYSTFMVTLTTEFSVPYSTMLAAQSRSAYTEDTIECIVRGASLVNNSSNELIYAWEVRQNGVVQSSHFESNQASFKLYPYTLIPNAVYQITALIFDPLVGMPVSSRQLVHVRQGPLVAQIAGGPVQTLLSGEGLVLDASSSYDADQPSALFNGYGAGLKYEWVCIGEQPAVTDGCYVDILSSKTSPSIVISASSGIANTTSLFFVSIRKDNRHAEAHVRVKVVSSLVSQVQFLQPSTSSMFNIDNEMVLQMQVANPTGYYLDLAIFESGFQTDSFVLQTNQLDATAPVFYYKLSAYALSGDKTYTFRARESGSSLSHSWATLSVVTNAPPQPGEFDVLIGDNQKNASHMLRGRFWEDIHIPISYSFGYYSSSDVKILVQLKSQQSFAFAQLLSLSSNVTCFMDVYDNYGAVQRVNRTITLSSNHSHNSADVASLSEKLFSHPLNDDLFSIANGILYFEQANCTLAPNCRAMHRFECKSTAHTCGACLDGFIGVSGDDNTICLTPSDAEVLSYDSLCSSNDDCPSLTFCYSSRCAPIPKPCDSRFCSNNGMCKYVDNINGEVLSNCSIVDSFCSAICSCNDGFSGDRCQYTSSEFSKAIQLKSDLSQLFYGPSSELLLNSRLSSIILEELAEVARIPSLLSETTVLAIQNVSSSLLSVMALSNPTFEELIPSLLLVDRIQGVNDWSNSTGNSSAVTTLLGATSDIIFNNVIPDIDADEFAGNSIRASFSAVSVEEELNMKVPRSDIEALFDLPQGKGSVLSYSNSDSTQALAVSMQSFTSRSITSPQWRTTSLPVRISYDPSISCSTFDCSLDITLYNKRPEQYFKPTIEEFNVTCALNVEKIYTFSCLDGSSLELYCTGGYSGVLVGICPYNATMPVCAKIVENVVSPDECSTLDYNADAVRCRCNLAASAATQRRLSTASFINSLDVVVTTQVQTVAAYVGEPIVPTAQPTYQPQYPHIGLIIQTYIHLSNVTANITSIEGKALKTSLYSVLRQNISDVVVEYVNASSVDLFERSSTVLLESSMSFSRFCSLEEAFAFYVAVVNHGVVATELFNNYMHVLATDAAVENLLEAFADDTHSLITQSSIIPTSTAYCAALSDTPSPTPMPTASSGTSSSNSGVDNVGATTTSNGLLKSPSTLLSYLGILAVFVFITIAYIILSNRRSKIMTWLFGWSNEGHQHKDRTLNLQGLHVGHVKGGESEFSPVQRSPKLSMNDQSYEYNISTVASPPPIYQTTPYPYDDESEGLSPNHASLFGIEHLASINKSEPRNRNIGQLRALGQHGGQGSEASDVGDSGMSGDGHVSESHEPSRTSFSRLLNMSMPKKGAKDRSILGLRSLGEGKPEGSLEEVAEEVGSVSTSKSDPRNRNVGELRALGQHGGQGSEASDVGDSGMSGDGHVSESHEPSRTSFSRLLNTSMPKKGAKDRSILGLRSLGEGKPEESHEPSRTSFSRLLNMSMPKKGAKDRSILGLRSLGEGKPEGSLEDALTGESTVTSVESHRDARVSEGISPFGFGLAKKKKRLIGDLETLASRGYQYDEAQDGSLIGRSQSDASDQYNAPDESVVPVRRFSVSAALGLENNKKKAINLQSLNTGGRLALHGEGAANNPSFFRTSSQESMDLATQDSPSNKVTNPGDNLSAVDERVAAVDNNQLSGGVAGTPVPVTVGPPALTQTNRSNRGYSLSSALGLPFATKKNNAMQLQTLSSTAGRPSRSLTSSHNVSFYRSESSEKLDSNEVRGIDSEEKDIASDTV